jgi:hypothetical protein
LRCLTNQRQITQAAYAYATANAGRWASPRTDEYGWTYPENTAGNAKHCWVKAQGGNVAGAYEKISALEQGVLWPYIGTVAAYVSPEEPTNPYALQNPGANTRVRSYSFNACLGVTRPDELADYDTPFMNPATGVSVPLSIYNTTTIATVKQPSRMMSTLVEDDNVAWNNEGWIISPQPSTRLWVDLPAPWRPDAITMTYVDGSTESYEMSNPLILEFSIDSVPLNCRGGTNNDVLIIVSLNLVPDLFVLFLAGQLENIVGRAQKTFERFFACLREVIDGVVDLDLAVIPLAQGDNSP